MPIERDEKVGSICNSPGTREFVWLQQGKVTWGFISKRWHWLCQLEDLLLHILPSPSLEEGTTRICKWVWYTYTSVISWNMLLSFPCSLWERHCLWALPMQNKKVPSFTLTQTPWPWTPRYSKIPTLAMRTPHHPADSKMSGLKRSKSDRVYDMVSQIWTHISKDSDTGQ